MVECLHSTVYTDHQSLVPSMAKKTEAQTERQANQLSKISEYTTDIRYLEGKSNVVANALSHPNGEGTEGPPTISNIVQLNNSIPEHLFFTKINRMRANGSLGVYLEETDGLDDVDEEIIHANDSVETEQQHPESLDEVEEKLDNLIKDLNLLGQEREKLKGKAPSTPTASSTRSSSSKKHQQQKEVTFASPVVTKSDSVSSIAPPSSNSDLQEFDKFMLKEMQQHPKFL